MEGNCKMKNIYATHDMTAGTYHNVAVIPDDVVAKRYFRNACKTDLGDYKDEFRLVKIGAFDEKTGHVLPCEPEVVMTGSEVQFNKESK